MVAMVGEWRHDASARMMKMMRRVVLHRCSLGYDQGDPTNVYIGSRIYTLVPTLPPVIMT